MNIHRIRVYLIQVWADHLSHLLLGSRLSPKTPPFGQPIINRSAPSNSYKTDRQQSAPQINSLARCEECCSSRLKESIYSSAERGISHVTSNNFAESPKERSFYVLLPKKGEFLCLRKIGHESVIRSGRCPFPVRGKSSGRKRCCRRDSLLQKTTPGPEKGTKCAGLSEYERNGMWGTKLERIKERKEKSHRIPRRPVVTVNHS